MAPKKNLSEHYEDGTLDLSLTSIQEVPVRDIAAIPKAINLDLSCNTIVSLPKSFATSLTRLVKLDLSQNQLASLPDNFGLLVNLKHLDLDNNKIVSLPLSFGTLKSLRWLDLKRNPLMPKLAQIAGLCLDAQQCQAAARNVVIALRAMQEQVNAEITRRKEEQSKKIESEENELNQNKENQRPSKKKKKKGTNSTSNNSDPAQANGHTHLTEDEDKSILKPESIPPSVPTKTAQNGLVRRVANILKATVKFMVMSLLVVVFCSFLLSLFDEDLYMTLRKKANIIIQTNVPKEYLKHWDKGLSVTRRAVVGWSSQIVSVSIHWFNKVQEYISSLSSNEVVQQYLESIKSGWHILWIWLNEKYTMLSVELPRYFNSFRRMLFESSSNTS